MRQASVEFGVASLGVILSALGILHAMNFPRESAYLPTAVLSLLMLLLIVWAVKAVVSLRRDSAGVLEFRKAEIRRSALLVTATIVLIGAAPKLGFATSFLFFVPITGYLLGYLRWKVLFLTGAVFASLIYLVFMVLLGRPLPTELFMRLI